jgi:hypothetical protein
MDEPTSALDPINMAKIEDLMGVSRMWGDGDAGDMTGRSVAGWGFADGVGLALG